MDVNQIIWSTLCGALSLLLFFIKRQANQNDRKIERIEERVNTMERDYITKAEYNELRKNFASLQDCIVRLGENIKEELHKTQLYSANTFVKREECEYCRGGK